MAIAFNAATTGTNNFSHTCSGDNRFLLVVIDQNGGNVTNVTYGGQALTALHEAAAGDGRLEVWYMYNPPIGANTISITGASSPSTSVVSYTGVKQLSGIINNTATQGTSSSASLAVTNPTENLAVSCGARPAAMTSNYSLRAMANYSSWRSAIADTFTVNPTFTWNIGITDWYMIYNFSLVPFKPSSGVSISNMSEFMMI